MIFKKKSRDNVPAWLPVSRRPPAGNYALAHQLNQLLNDWCDTSKENISILLKLKFKKKVCIIKSDTFQVTEFRLDLAFKR